MSWEKNFIAESTKFSSKVDTLSDIYTPGASNQEKVDTVLSGTIEDTPKIFLMKNYRREYSYSDDKNLHLYKGVEDGIFWGVYEQEDEDIFFEVDLKEVEEVLKDVGLNDAYGNKRTINCENKLICDAVFKQVRPRSEAILENSDKTEATTSNNSGLNPTPPLSFDDFSNTPKSVDTSASEKPMDKKNGWSTICQFFTALVEKIKSVFTKSIEISPPSYKEPEGPTYN